MVIVTNGEQWRTDAPGGAKFGLMDDGRLRHLGPSEWYARGAKAGWSWSNAEIDAAGWWTPATAQTAKVGPFNLTLTGVAQPADGG